MTQYNPIKSEQIKIKNTLQSFAFLFTSFCSYGFRCFGLSCSSCGYRFKIHRIPAAVRSAAS